MAKRMNRDDRRQWIVDQAIQMYRRVGSISLITRNKLSREIGVSTGLITHHFSPFRDLIDEVISRTR